MSLFSRINNSRASSGNSNQNGRPVCNFYLEGRCKFGDSCRNYHPPRDGTSNSSGGNTSRNLPFHLTVDGIKADLTDEKPQWPLSSFGPGRDAPRQLLEGAVEQSPEELRVQYYLAKNSGSGTQGYESEEKNILDQANGQTQRILSDLDGAIKFVIDGKDVHPNREDFVQKAGRDFEWRAKPSFGQDESKPNTFGAFGQTSAAPEFGGGSNAPAFGQASAPGTSTSTFGQPSAFGKPSTSAPAFGQPSGPSAFGAPSALGSSTSASGRPSALGGGGGGTSAFGQPSTLGGGGGGTSAFGQASALGGGGSTPFGGAQTSTTTGGSTFGQPSAFGAKSSPFGSSTGVSTSTAFGQPSAFGGGGSVSTQTSSTAFGQPSAPGQQQPAFGRPSPFGSGTNATGTSSSPFGQQPQQPTQSAFGRPSPFASSSGANGTTTSAFGQPSAPGPKPIQSNPFASSTQTSTTPFSASSQPQQNGSAARTAGQPGQPIKSWKGRPVTYENGAPYYSNLSTGKPERIWHPDGPPGPNPDVEAAPTSIYDEPAVGEVLKRVYEYVKVNGFFGDDGGAVVIPEVPPKREWVSWEL